MRGHKLSNIGESSKIQEAVKNGARLEEPSHIEIDQPTLSGPVQFDNVLTVLYWQTFNVIIDLFLA